MKQANSASKAEIEIAVLGDRPKGVQKQKLDRTLTHLITDIKILKRYREYEIVKDMEWRDTLMDLGTPINFEMPYLNDFAYFNWGDLINYFGNDPNTKNILIYMESISDTRGFLSAAREVALTKPIILIKAGKTTESAKAAKSHTGALAGSDEVLNAA